MFRNVLRIAPKISRSSLVVSRAPRVLATRGYAGAALDPESNYDAFVDKWAKFFREVDDETDLEVGLNECFTYDWVPAVGVIEEALKASRRLNTFPTAVRILEGIEERAENDGQYQSYVSALKPLLNELGVVERKDLGLKD